MHELKIRRIGNSLGVTLPREALARLKVAEGERIFLTETPDGFSLTPYDETFKAAMDAFEEGRGRYRNALRELARTRASG
jgi:putative addiction module antidote